MSDNGKKLLMLSRVFSTILLLALGASMGALAGLLIGEVGQIVLLLAALAIVMVVAIGQAVVSEALRKPLSFPKSTGPFGDRASERVADAANAESPHDPRP